MNANEKLDELSPEEKAAFTLLHRERNPSPALEQKVVTALKSHGHIRTGNVAFSRPLLSLGMRLALAAALIAGGFFLAKLSSQPAPLPVAEPKNSLFLLLLYNDPDAKFPDSVQAFHRDVLVQEYSAWIAGVRESDRIATGERLEGGGYYLIRANGGQQIIPFQPTASETVLQGYFLIEAEDFDEAIAISQSCPHLEYGGKIELREIARE